MAYEGLLAPVIQAAEGITAMRDDRQHRKLRDIYLGRQAEMQETQFANQQEDRQRAQQLQDMQVLYNVVSQVEAAPDSLQATRAVTADPRIQQIMQRMGVPLQIPPDATPETMKAGAAKLRQQLAAFLPQAAPEAFNLSPGQARFVGNTKIAELPANEPGLTPYQQEQLRLQQEQVDLQRQGLQNKQDEQAKEREAKQQQVMQTWRTYVQARDGLLSGLQNTQTGPVVGRTPAVTSAQQAAEGGHAAMAPVLKQLFRVAGEGVFTDKDQELLLRMIPDRKDRPPARKIKIENIDRIIREKLGVPDDIDPSVGGPKPDLVYIPGQGFVDAAR